jgi:ketosteroid isomerase-like protein
MATATVASVPTSTNTSTTNTNVRDRVDALIEYIQTGRILEAMTEFYAPDAQMQENANPPTTGLAANIEREKQFLSNVKEWRGFAVKGLAVDGDVSFMESTIDFVAQNGADVHVEQVSVARWRDGKIVHERFYYDPAASGLEPRDVHWTTWARNVRREAT